MSPKGELTKKQVAYLKVLLNSPNSWSVPVSVGDLADGDFTELMTRELVDVGWQANMTMVASITPAGRAAFESE